MAGLDHALPEQGNATFQPRLGDLERLPFADQSFDAVICVFGIFFVPDLEGAVRGLWRLVRPGGYLAITIWGAKMFEPADGKFWEAVRQALGLRSASDWKSSPCYPLVVYPYDENLI